jgi:hypothetical protein
MNDSKKALLAGIAVMALLTVIWWFTGNKTISGGSEPPELSVDFVGFTNNPVETMTPVRVCVAQGTTGFCALFRVTNHDSTHFAKFDTAGLEVNNGHGWEPSPSPGPLFGVGGDRWQPGYGCLCAVGWPPGVSTNAAWRLQISVAHELISWDKTRWGIRDRINWLLHREVFGLYDQQTITSSEVRL